MCRQSTNAERMSDHPFHLKVPTNFCPLNLSRDKLRRETNFVPKVTRDRNLIEEVPKSLPLQNLSPKVSRRLLLCWFQIPVDTVSTSFSNAKTLALSIPILRMFLVIISWERKGFKVSHRQPVSPLLWQKMSTGDTKRHIAASCWTDGFRANHIFIEKSVSNSKNLSLKLASSTANVCNRVANRRKERGHVCHEHTYYGRVDFSTRHAACRAAISHRVDPVFLTVWILQCCLIFQPWWTNRPN